jgi:hypothetical protein
MLEIEHPISGAKIILAKKDFPENMTWHEAQRACVGLGDGWRLPTIEEWQVIYELFIRNKLGDFKGSHYWCSNESGVYSAWLFILPFLDYKAETKELLKDAPMNVRAVRTL